MKTENGSTIVLISNNHIYSTRQKEDYMYKDGKWHYAGFMVPVRENVSTMINEELEYPVNKHISIK